MVLQWIGWLNSSMGEVATAKMDERGRIVVPTAVRDALGVRGESAIVRIEIEVRERNPGSDG